MKFAISGKGGVGKTTFAALLAQAYADAGRKITPEALNITYNNFYEFGTSKRISKAAEALVIRPWEIRK